MSGARYVEPLTVGEAVAALAENSGARCLAGGQTLVAMMIAGLVAPPLVVGLRRVAELKVIDFDATGSVVIGAMTTHAALAESKGYRADMRYCAKRRPRSPIRRSATWERSAARCHMPIRTPTILRPHSPPTRRSRSSGRPAGAPSVRPTSSWIF